MGLVLAQNFTDLCDVDIVNATNGQIVQYNGSHWVNIDDSVINSLTSNNNNTIGVAPTTGNVVLYPKYELLCQNTLTGNSSTLACSSFSARNFLKVDLYLPITMTGTGVLPSIQFNGDTGNNYSYRTEVNGGADTTLTATNKCQLTTTANNEGGSFTSMTVINYPTTKKLSHIDTDGYLNRATISAPTKIVSVCKWENTANQVTTITAIIISGTDLYNTGARISVWGYD